MPQRINLANYVERKNDAGAIVIELADGEITVPPAELWSDKAHAAAMGNKMAEATKLILGDEQHARFVAAGGNWRILNGIIEQAQGVDVPNSPGSDGS